jgi:hypothetical protein
MVICFRIKTGLKLRDPLPDIVFLIIIGPGATVFEAVPAIVADWAGIGDTIGLAVDLISPVLNPPVVLRSAECSVRTETRSGKRSSTVDIRSNRDPATTHLLYGIEIGLCPGGAGASTWV